ncbi:MAG: ribbon-helix-helix protein, CopG family [Caldilineaceae bacterium SB0661_bin_34]|nr:ribbon-helix-helix protein, CopG family [Caldilineaceae bacterium SB0661_bin_34]
MVLMARTTKTITFSLPPEMAERVNEVAAQQGSSRSEFLRTAVVRYIEEHEWRQLLQYGEQKAREEGIGPEDVARLVEEYRSETNPART